MLMSGYTSSFISSNTMGGEFESDSLDKVVCCCRYKHCAR